MIFQGKKPERQKGRKDDAITSKSPFTSRDPSRSKDNVRGYIYRTIYNGVRIDLESCRFFPFAEPPEGESEGGAKPQKGSLGVGNN